VSRGEKDGDRRRPTWPDRNRWRLKADDLSEVYGKTSSKTLGEMRAKQGILSVGFCVGFKG